MNEKHDKHLCNALPGGAEGALMMSSGIADIVGAFTDPPKCAEPIRGLHFCGVSDILVIKGEVNPTANL